MQSDFSPQSGAPSALVGKGKKEMIDADTSFNKTVVDLTKDKKRKRTPEPEEKKPKRQKWWQMCTDPDPGMDKAFADHLAKRQEELKRYIEQLKAKQAAR